MQISQVDLIIIVAYFIFIVGLGCWAGLRKKKSQKADEYFLAGKSLRWPVIGLALFATNISTVHLVSLAEEGYTNGLAYGNFEWMAPFTLIILALFFAPFYIRSRVTTLPDFLEKRYSRASRDWLALLSIISAIFIHIGFSLYAGAVVLEGMFGIGKMTSIILIAAIEKAKYPRVPPLIKHRRIGDARLAVQAKNVSSPWLVLGRSKKVIRRLTTAVLSHTRLRKPLG